jgi:hypothetical protein
MAFVSAALSAKTLRVGYAEIQSSALISSGVVEVDADAMHAGWHRKGNIEVGLILRTFDVAGKHQIRLLLLLRDGPRCKPKREHHETKAPKLHNVQVTLQIKFVA